MLVTETSLYIKRGKVSVTSVVTVSKCFLSVGFGRFCRKNLDFRFGLGFHDKLVTPLRLGSYGMTFVIASSNDKQPHTLSIMHSKTKKAIN